VTSESPENLRGAEKHVVPTGHPDKRNGRLAAMSGGRHSFRMAQAEVDLLRSVSTTRRCLRSATVLFQGEPSDCLYVVLDGYVKIYRTASDGRARVLQLLGPMDALGEVGLLDGQPRCGTAEAIWDCELLRTPREAFADLSRLHPDLTLKLQHIVCARLRRETERGVDLACRDVRFRLARTLLDLADDHGVEDEGGIRLLPPVTHRDLAGLVGANRETISRWMAQMEAQGAIAQDGRLRVVAPERLRHVLSSETARGQKHKEQQP